MASCSENKNENFTENESEFFIKLEQFDVSSDMNSNSDSDDSKGSFNDIKWPLDHSYEKEILSCTIQDDPPGLRGPPKFYGDHADPLPVWQCLFTDDMIAKIMRSINNRLFKMRENYAQKKKADLTDVDEIELKAFLGLLYFSSILKSQHEDLDSLFATDGTGREIFRGTMSLRRLLNILLCLILDDPENESTPSNENSITWLFDHLVLNSQQCYCVGENVCIDKMLVNYSGCLKYPSQSVRHKSAKRGVRVFALCDVRTSYLFNGYVYTGRNCHGHGLSSEDRSVNNRTQSVLRLVQPIMGTNRNVTASKWFGSIEVVNELTKRNLTYTGPLRKTIKEIPAEFLQVKGRSLGTSLYVFMKNATLLSFVTEDKKVTIIVSSKHQTEEENQTENPDLVTFYNSTRGAVETMENNCFAYSTYNRRAARLATAVFYAALNIAAMNSFILYGCYANNPNTSRYNFIKGLAKELVEPHMKRRVLNKTLPREIRTSITRIIGEPIMHTSAAKDKGKVIKRRRCQLCPSANDKKTSIQCLTCSRAMCGNCRYMICKECGVELQ